MQQKLETLQYFLTSPFLDIGKPEECILLFGMGRSGTTWVANIINHDKSYRILFEPFFPSLVQEANQFEYIQYMDPKNEESPLAVGARKILAGKTRSQWVDKENDGLFYRRRLIKDIRCNLMVGWLKKLAPNLPIIQLIRHPLQVAYSWQKLGWGKEALGQRSDFDIIMSQHGLCKDFPHIKSIAKQIDPSDFLDNVIFLWGVFHSIPAKQLQHNDTYYLFYEHLLTTPEEECKKLFKYLKKKCSWKQVQKAVVRESSTNFQQRDLKREKQLLLNGWREKFSESEIQRAYEILAMFEVDSIYNANGFPTEKNIFSNNQTPS